MAWAFNHARVSAPEEYTGMGTCPRHPLGHTSSIDVLRLDLALHDVAVRVADGGLLRVAIVAIAGGAGVDAAVVGVDAGAGRAAGHDAAEGEGDGTEQHGNEQAFHKDAPWCCRDSCTAGNEPLCA